MEHIRTADLAPVAGIPVLDQRAVVSDGVRSLLAEHKIMTQYCLHGQRRPLLFNGRGVLAGIGEELRELRSSARECSLNCMLSYFRA